MTAHESNSNLIPPRWYHRLAGAVLCVVLIAAAAGTVGFIGAMVWAVGKEVCCGRTQ